MKLFMLSFVLVGALVLAVQAEPEPEPAKGRRSSYFNEPANPKFRSALIVDDEAELRQAEVDAADDNESDTNNAPGQADASSGRLFMKKFLLFKNMFGSTSQTQPVIPIIITGGGTTGTTGTSPTTTITSTGTIPTATGTITTSPITTRAAGHRSGYNSEDEDEEFAAEEAAEAAEVTEEQALQAALGAGAQEYIVTNQEIQGTSDSKGTKQPSRINLKRKGGKRGQVISVRVPPKYRNMFKNGQRVMLNTGKRPAQNKRRVYKKRGNNNKRRRVVNKNKNKRTRIVAA